jgi:hypothetical protein
MLLSGVDESALRVHLRLHGAPLQLQLPLSSEHMFELECDASDLSELHSILATFAFEQEELTLDIFLDKLVTVYQKLFTASTPAAASSSSSSAPAAAAAVSKKRASDVASMEVDSADGFSDSDAAMADDGDDGFGGEGDWGDFKEQNQDEEIHDDAWAATKTMKKRLISKAEEARIAAAHATEQQKQGKDGIKSIFSSEAAVTMLVNDCMAFMASTDPGLRVNPVNESVFQWAVKLSQFAPESKIQQGLQQLKQTYAYDYVELEVKFMPDRESHECMRGRRSCIRR